MQARNKTLLVAALMLVQFLSAMDITVVTLAVPTIAADLHGLAYVSLIFAAYMLTSAIATPFYGKLSDLYGRKHILQFGLALFLVGSALCGVSPTMPLFIAARALQGLGAGSIYVMAMTIVGDVFPLERQAGIVGALSTVWSIAGVAGPFIGGLLIDTLGWHWIFFLNIPLTLFAIVVIQVVIKEQRTARRHTLDAPGATLLTLAIVVLLAAFTLVDGTNLGEQAIMLVIAAAITAVLLVVFVRVERKAGEPFVPVRLLTGKVMAINAIAFFASVILTPMNVYLPIYLQNVLGNSATVSGLVILAQSVSWCAVSLLMGKVLMVHGPKPILVVANGILAVSCAALVSLGVQTPIVLTMVFLFVSGAGFGGCFTAVTVAVQDSSDNANRGAVMGVMSLARSLGSTVGVSVFGALFNIGVVGYFAGQGVPGINPDDVYTLAQTNPLVSAAQVTDGLMSTIHILLIAMTIVAVVVLVISVLMPRIRFEKK
jgi:EmrB/QacA subfamily drug resistance transporter